jgi:hypothetical protein
MAKVVVGMTMSLDGFVADESGSVSRLYPDLAALRGTEYMDAAIEETGAVLMGRKTFEMGPIPLPLQTALGRPGERKEPNDSCIRPPHEQGCTEGGGAPARAAG